MGPPEDEAPAGLRGPGQGGHTLSHPASQPQGGSSVGSPRLGGSIDHGAAFVDRSVRAGGGAIAQRQPRLLRSPLPDVGLGAMVVAGCDRGSSVVTDDLPADAVDADALATGEAVVLQAAGQGATCGQVDAMMLSVSNSSPPGRWERAARRWTWPGRSSPTSCGHCSSAAIPAEPTGTNRHPVPGRRTSRHRSGRRPPAQHPPAVLAQEGRLLDWAPTAAHIGRHQPALDDTESLYDPNASTGDLTSSHGGRAAVVVSPVRCVGER